MILAAAALLLPAVSDAVTFAPVLDRPYQLSVREERSDPTGTHHYGADRTVIFRREADGLVAEVTLLRVTQDVGGETGRRFERSAGALTGRTLRFHLGPDGAVRSIDDQAAVWQAMLAGIAAMGERTPAGVTGIGRSPAAPLAALSPERVQSVIGSILRPAIASTLPAPGMHPVTVPSRALAAAGSSPARRRSRLTRTGRSRLRSTQAAPTSRSSEAASSTRRTASSSRRRRCRPPRSAPAPKSPELTRS